MDLTPPGSPVEGHIYLNDPTGEIITYYKSTKVSTSKKEGEETKHFATPEGLISYLTTLPSSQKSANSLSQTEMDIITDIAKSYGFKSNIDYIGPKATGTPFMAILDKSGQVRFTVRKLANKFFCYKVVYTPNVIKGTPESVVHQGDWNTLIKELHVQLSTLAQPTMTTPDADPNKLSMSELKAISKLAKSHMLSTTQPIVTTVEPPSIVIQNNMGSNVWAVRKSEGKYQIISTISAQNWEILEQYSEFSTMLMRLNKLFEKYTTEPQAPEKMGAFEFSPQESSDISKLASQFGLLIKGTTMTLEPDKHQVAGIEIIKPDGKIVFHVHKDNGTYSIFKVFDNGAGSKTWDNWYQGQNANAFFQQLTLYLNGHTPGEPQSAEHNGITPEEAEQIKMEVEQYGPLFWTEYVKGSMGQTAYVEVFHKFAEDKVATIVFSVGALSNYYQINDAQNKPKETSPTFGGIVARIHDRLAELSGQKSEPHQVSVPHKLLQEEQEEIVKIVGKYSPAIKYQFSPDDAVVIWIGNNITSYKIAKENDVYRVYTDKDSEWVIQNQTSTFNELTAYLDDMLAHIAKALANSKLTQPPQQTAPSLNPDKLSASEVDELKKLLKQFKLPVSTSYSKKLMEAAGVPQEAYSMTVMDEPHKVYIKIYKQQGKYIFAKGLSDAYFPLKSFSNFEQLLAYADYFFNSYIKGELPAVDKISDDEVKMLRDLVKKFKVKGKVRRKYMTSSGQKVPYVFIELDDIGMKDYAVSKTAKGVYKLFEVDTLFEDWKNLAVTDTWEGIYDIVSKVLNDEPIPDDNEKYNPPVLNADQFEWLETLMKTQKPGVFVKKWGNGVIGGYDPSNKISGESNPLFVIRFAPSGGGKRILQVQTADGGMNSEEYPFNTFEALAHFIATNIDIVTQLLKGDIAPEGKLAGLMDKGGFKFHHDKTNVEIDGVNKAANVYENDNNDRIYLFSDGGSRVWYMDKTVGDIVSKDFKTIPELVDWMEKNYEEKSSSELKEIQEYVEYLGFTMDASKSDKFETVWTKQVGPDHQKSWDIVKLASDGTAKVRPSPLIGDPQHDCTFYFNTAAALTQYLTEKYSKGNNFAEKYLEKVLVEGKFQKIADEDGTEMGFKWVTNKMMVIPFPSGGIMETPEGVEPHVRFTFESTYDLARRLELYIAGDIDYQDPGWATGNDQLDELIDKAGFIYQGHEETQEGQKLVFLDAGGIKLVYYTADETSTIMFLPSSTGQQGINFTNVEDLIDHLKKYNEPPATADTFAKNAGYAELLQTLAGYEFKYTHVNPDPELQPHKMFKRPDGAMVTIWDTGVCSYKAPSDKAEWQYSKSFSELDDKLKKLYNKVTTTSEYPSILKYDPETQDLITKDLSHITFKSQGIDSVHFQYNSNALGQGEIRVVGGNVLKFAIGKKIVGNNVLWYIRQKVSDNPSGLYMVYTFVEHHKDAMVKWITDNIKNLATHKSVKDADGYNLGTAEGPTVGVVKKEEDPKGSMYYPDKEVVDLIKSKGFEPEYTVKGTSWVHPSKFHFELYENGIMWHFEKGSKEIGIAKADHYDFLKKALVKAVNTMDDEQLDQLFSAASVSRQEKLLAKAIDIAAGLEGAKMLGSEIDKALHNRGFEWYDEERCWVNDELYQVVIVNPKDSVQSVFRYWWVEGKEIKSGSASTESELLQWVGPGGKIGQQTKITTDVETGEQFVPSGETYKAHDIAGNADMIWLNEHDTALLQSLGFVPVASENQYYKNPTGNIVKFFDTGKAEYVDYFGHPNQPENGEVVEFEDIPHTLKFMVAKHNSFPFSVHNYKSDDGTDVLEIPLNQHDNDMLKQLGFEWDVKGQKYIKFIGPNDTPKLNEAKKKKEDPNQMGLPFGGPLHPDKPSPPPDDPGEIPPNDDWEDYFEVFTAYDTGNAIWQSMKEGTLAMDKELEKKEGTIANVLQFIWKRWQHQLALGLSGKITAKGQPPTSPDTIAFLNIEGIEAPPNIHEKFLKRGFIYDTSLKGYYKKYELDPKLLWTLVKWDGNLYHVSRPYKSYSGKIEHKEFTNPDPYLVLNTILKIENAEFMDLVQSEEDALKKKDASYFNAPNGWLPYHPYSPKKNPNNITPESWIDKELGGYGFVWKPNSGMYYLVDTEGKIGTNWHAVRFDQNGTIVYFYHNKKGDPRYFCSKDFAEVQHKIEVNHPGAELFQPGGTSAGTVPPKLYPLDAKNYPTAPDWDKNFSTQGNVTTLKPADHKAVLEVGFKFSIADGIYSNTKTKDQFKIFSNGFAWYAFTGIGEGMDNNLEHFFDMLKSKYGQLEWGFHPLTGHEVVQIKDKFDKMGFQSVEHPEAGEDLYFERFPSKGLSNINTKEVVVVFPDHTMNFYLYDTTSKDRLLGVSEFESLTYGIHTLEDLHVDAIKLHLAQDLEAEVTSQGFTYVGEKQRYEYPHGNGGLKISITFFGDGQADANLWEPDSSTSDGFEEVKEKTFVSFYDAILWAAHKNFEIEPQPPTPVSKKEVAKAMKDLGFKDQGHLSPDVVTYNTSLGKVINVNLKNGKVDYSFQYVADDTTGELKWGKSTFYNWPVFMDFLKGTTKVKPTTGKLTYTPHPATKALPKMVPPGQGPPIKGKIQPPENKSVPGMPFSDYDYEGWAKGTEHNPNATIKLVNNDDLLMHQLGFFAKKTDNDAYYYHNNKGDFVYFFVDGHAKIIPKDSAPITLPKVKMAISMLWAQHHEDNKTTNAGINDPANWGVKPTASGGLDVTNELIDLGFHPLVSSGGELIFEKKDKKITHLVRWNKDENTIDYTAHKSGDSSVVTASWEEDVNVGLAMLGHIFTPKLTEQEFVVEKMEELGFKVMGGKPPQGAQSSTITFIRYTPKFQYDVVYHVDQKMMEFIKSEAKMKKGYHKIVEQWTLNVSDAIGKLENLFAFGSLGTVQSKKKKLLKLLKKKKLLAGTEDMPWSDTDYLNWGNVVLKAMGTVKDGMSLHPTEVATLKQMGWKEVGNSKIGYSYVHGIEKIVFHPSGYVEYWSNKNGHPTQHWQEIEMPIRWLWKNKGSVQTPKVPLVYVSIPLLSLEEEKLKSLGFVRLQNNGVTWYEKPGEGQWVMFYKDGHANIKDKITGTEVDYFNTAAEAITFLSNKYFKTSKKKTPTVTGEMPWSGGDYNVDLDKIPPGVDAANMSIRLLHADEKTMASIGFKYVWNPDETEEYRNSYVKSEETVYFYANGSAEYRDISDVDDKGNEISKVFNTVKEAMEFVWNKHMPFIEESFFKDLVDVLMTRPGAAKMLM